MSYQSIQRLAQVQSEWEVAKASVASLERGWPRLHSDPAFQNLQLAKVRQTHANLKTIYIIHLFSVFEAILRDFLPRSRPAAQPDRRSVYDLINRIASKFSISSLVRDEVHQVREYRNRVVHQSRIIPAPLVFSDAQAALNRFLAWLPN